MPNSACARETPTITCSQFVPIVSRTEEFTYDVPAPQRRGHECDETSLRPIQAEPFGSAEQAWFWTVGALAARRDATSCSSSRIARPCDPDDVVRCLDRLYRQRRIDLLHARILRIWGERQSAPNPAYASEKSDWHIWREAIDRLEWPLRAKGIVG